MANFRKISASLNLKSIKSLFKSPEDVSKLTIKPHNLIRNVLIKKKYGTSTKEDYEQLCILLKSQIDKNFDLVRNELKLLYFPIGNKLSNLLKPITPRELENKEYWFQRKLSKVISTTGFYEVTSDLQGNICGIDHFKIWIQNSNLNKDHFNLFLMYRDHDSNKLKMKIFQNILYDRKNSQFNNINYVLPKPNLKTISPLFNFACFSVPMMGLVISSISPGLLGVVFSLTGVSAITWSLTQVYHKNYEINFYRKQYDYSNEKLVANGWQAFNCMLNMSKDEIFKNTLLTYTILLGNKVGNLPMKEIHINSFGQKMIQDILNEPLIDLPNTTSQNESKVPSLLMKLFKISKETPSEKIVENDTHNDFTFNCQQGLIILKKFNLIRETDEGFSVVNIHDAKKVLGEINGQFLDEITLRNPWNVEESFLSYEKEHLE